MDTKLGIREKGIVLPLPTLTKGTRLLGGEKYLLIVFGYKHQLTDPPETVDMLDAIVVPDSN